MEDETPAQNDMTLSDLVRIVVKDPVAKYIIAPILAVLIWIVGVDYNAVRKLPPLVENLDLELRKIKAAVDPIIVEQKVKEALTAQAKSFCDQADGSLDLLTLRCYVDGKPVLLAPGAIDD